MRRSSLILSTLTAFTLPPQGPDLPDASRASSRLSVPARVLTTMNGVEVRQGGFGSALAIAPGAAGFLLLTDRGPNVDMPREDQKGFPVPEYSPTIGEFRWTGDSLAWVRDVTLRLGDGGRITGRPNPPGPGSIGESAVTMDGQELPPDPHGLDTEGLVAMADGSFWVSDEYGPWLLNFGPDGRLRERAGPFAASGRMLPMVLAARRPNRGMEGLTLIPGTTRLLGLMQSPLDNPKRAGRKSRSVRLVGYDPGTGASEQFVYLLDDPGYRTTEIAAVSATSFLVLEIDGKVPGDSTAPSRFQRVFQVDLGSATDVSDPVNGARGRLFGARTLEEIPPDSLAAAGVIPVRKRLLLDLLDPAIGYPHAKPEGLAILDEHTIAIANDDDFGIAGDGRGGMVANLRPDGELESNEVWLFRLAAPLR